jgi:DNA adenine methylase
MKLSRGKDGTKGPMTPLARQFMGVDHLRGAASRLRGVSVEEMDAIEFMEMYDYDRAFFYVDPPYPFDTRVANGSHYMVDSMSNNDHCQMAAVLNDIDGMAIVSGYACELYTELYEARGWLRVDKSARMDGGGSAIESLWISPRTRQALEAERARHRVDVEQMRLI